MWLHRVVHPAFFYQHLLFVLFVLLLLVVLLVLVLVVLDSGGVCHVLWPTKSRGATSKNSNGDHCVSFVPGHRDPCFYDFEMPHHWYNTVFGRRLQCGVRPRRTRQDDRGDGDFCIGVRGGDTVGFHNGVVLQSGVDAIG